MRLPEPIPPREDGQTIFCDFYVYGLIDGAGDTLRAVCGWDVDAIEIAGVFPENHPTHPSGEFNFCDDALCLKRFAEENGLEHFKHGYNFEQLGTPHIVYED